MHEDGEFVVDVVYRPVRIRAAVSTTQPPSVQPAGIAREERLRLLCFPTAACPRCAPTSEIELLPATFWGKEEAGAAESAAASGCQYGDSTCAKPI